MIHLLLLRHGQTEWNNQSRYQGQTDISLNEAGRDQAESAAPRMSAYSIDAVYASDLKRAWETAEIVSRGTGLEVRPDPRLREMSFGVFEGLTFDEINEQWPNELSAWITDRSNTPPEGEPKDQFVGRLKEFLADIEANHQDEVVLIVSHGGPLKAIIRLLLGLNGSARWTFKLSNCSLTEIMLYEPPLLVRLNDRGHFT